MNDTELLDWAFEHLTGFHANFDGEFFTGKFLLDWTDKMGNEQHTQGANLRDCIRGAMVMETEQQNKTTATVERRPLTEEQIKDCILQSNTFGNVRLKYATYRTEEVVAIVRAIEKAHGIKELKE